MNAHPNAVSESRFATESVAAQTTRPTHPFFWSVRRELWENRSIYIAPLAAAGFAVLATSFNNFRNFGLLGTAPDNIQAQQLVITRHCNLAALLIMGTTFVVAIFYCLDAMYGERRDRSIFFWKSLPVSDTVAVLSKAAIPLVIIPLVTFAITVVTQWILIALDAATLAGIGRSAGVIGHVPLLHMQAALLYHLMAVHSLWYAPIFAWFLLVSAFAPKAPILWALLPPIFIEILESIAFHTSYFSRFLSYRFGGGMSDAGLDAMGMPHRAFSGSPAQFFVSPGLWTGLILAAIFLAAAIQIRRYRSPS